MSFFNAVRCTRHIDKVSLVTEAVNEGRAEGFVLYYFVLAGEDEEKRHPYS